MLYTELAAKKFGAIFGLERLWVDEDGFENKGKRVRPTPIPKGLLTITGQLCNESLIIAKNEKDNIERIIEKHKADSFDISTGSAYFEKNICHMTYAIQLYKM